MNNTIYLMQDKKFDFCLFKVGFTTNPSKRFTAYASHNPTVRCISTVQTQERSKRNIEKAFHTEIEKMGYNFLHATINGKKTEWFTVAYNDPFYTELCCKGLSAFVTGRNRKNNGEYREQ